MKVAINGFGRIGRSVFRAMLEHNTIPNEFEVVAINDLVDADNLAYLLKYDSIQGGFKGEVSSEGDSIIVNGQSFKSLNIKDGPAAMPWGELGVDVVVEATGVFTAREKVQGHLDAGAKYVVVTGPSGDLDMAVVPGVNHEQLDPEVHKLVTLTSCTTNAAAPVMKVLVEEGFGIESAFLNTVHSYTATQSLVDSPGGKDFRRGRAAALNIVPSSTGAAEACALVLPELDSKFNGLSLRVPTATVSIADITLLTQKDTTYEEIIDAMRRASDSYLKGIMRVTDEEIVSSDLIHDPHSSIVDTTMGMGSSNHPRFFKLMSWYDNEWGFSNRVLDVVRLYA